MNCNLRKGLLLMKHRILALLLALLLALSLCPAAAAAQPENTLTANGILKISKYGNVSINLTHEEVLRCFDPGDIVTVSFADQTMDMPLCSAYSDVDIGNCALCLINDHGDLSVELCCNMRSFASTFGLARQPDPEQPKIWEYCDGYSAETVFTISLKEKAGYLGEYRIRHLEYTDARTDYPQLSDAEFANFRSVTVGSIAPGVLYRSASPVNPENCRNTYADAAAKAAGVTQFIDLTDTEDDLAGYEGYADSYFATQSHFARSLTVNCSEESNRAKMADAFRYMARNSGVYDVFCREGKDRSGYVVALLECLMGADCTEVVADYMISFRNYYGILQDDRAYTAISDGNILLTLEELFGTDPRTADLSAEAENYIFGLGLTAEEIAQLKANLSGTAQPFADVSAADWFAADIAFVSENGLMTGTSENRFSPALPLTRGMAAVILHRFAGEPHVAYYARYSDVDASRYDAEAIGWASAEGIVTGYSAETFGPNDPVTREQFATMLYRYSQRKGLDVSAGAALTGFADAGAVSEYALPAVEWAVACGLLRGDDACCIRPAAFAARAEAAALLHRYCSESAAFTAAGTSATELMQRYAMADHVENGSYLERHYVYEGEGRPASGSIYYYVAPGESTEFHQIDCDEYWCYAAGTPLELWMVDEDGNITSTKLGIDVDCNPIVYIRSGLIFASRHYVDGDDGTFLSCITVPRYSDDGFTLFPKETMLERYPGIAAFYD